MTKKGNLYCCDGYHVHLKSRCLVHANDRDEVFTIVMPDKTEYHFCCRSCLTSWLVLMSSSVGISNLWEEMIVFHYHVAMPEGSPEYRCDGLQLTNEGGVQQCDCTTSRFFTLRSFRFTAYFCTLGCMLTWVARG